jgi:hypothetical protein
VAEPSEIPTTEELADEIAVSIHNTIAEFISGDDRTGLLRLKAIETNLTLIAYGKWDALRAKNSVIQLMSDKYSFREESEENELMIG